MFNKIRNWIKRYFMEDRLAEKLKNSDGTYTTYSLWGEL